jgi:predicted regulator of Ras-like GTPase activity (Roadblock/LC7/MglB family)
MPSPSQRLLALLHDVPDAQAVTLMGHDGLPVAHAESAPTGHDLPTLWTEYAQMLVVMRRASQEVPGPGAPGDLVIHLTQSTLLLRPLTAQYYLALLQRAQAPAGRARLYMAQVARELHADLF